VLLEAPGVLGEGRARHRRDDGRDPGLVPPDAEVEDARPGSLDLAGQGRHLVPGLALLDEVEHGDAVDDDEVRPGGLAHGAHGLDREPAALLGGASPGVRAVVGPGREELVDEVALGPHDLDAVVTGLTRQAGRTGEPADLPPHSAVAERSGLELADGALHRRRRDAPRGVGVAAGVQDLQGDAATLRVHGIRHLTVLAGLTAGRHLRGEGVERALDARGEPPGDDEGGSPTGALGEVGGELGEVAGVVLQAGVHRTHDDPVGERDVPEVEGGQQVGVLAHVTALVSLGPGSAPPPVPGSSRLRCYRRVNLCGL
jgi:hypothetical protein